tara:strand:+ start:2708 stop:3382 length:675 start_codon:yes stop_codon:yes gene_type:complete
MNTTYVFITCHGTCNKKINIDSNILENVNIRKINAVRPGIINYTFSKNIHYMINLILYFITYNIINNIDIITNYIITILKENDSSYNLYKNKSLQQIKNHFKYNDNFPIDEFFLNYYHDLSHMYYDTSTLIYDKIYEIYKNENDYHTGYDNKILYINKQGTLQSIFKRSELANIYNEELVISTSDIIKKLKKDFDNIIIIDFSCMEIQETNRYIRNIKNRIYQI